MMTSYQEILSKVQNKESAFLKSIITGELIFPCKLSINKQETGNLEIDSRVYTTLYSNSKNSKKIGYTIEYKTTKTTQITRLSKVIIENESDFIYLLNKKNEVDTYKDSIYKFKRAFKDPIIDDYLIKNRKQIFNSSELYIDNFIEVALYLLENQNERKYPRELDIKADTKFLSNNIQRITTLLSYFREIDFNLNKYERIGLINPYSTVTLRLANNFTIKGNGNSFNTELTNIDLEELKSFKNTFDKVFVIENRTTFLKFPLKNNQLAIYMGGFAISILQDIPFLLEANLYYFGDLDEHGFEILSLFRSIYPNTKSICMNLDTINEYSDYLISGREFRGNINNLTENEEIALKYLINHKINGQSARIEQEKISQSYINNQIDFLTNN